jgi:hypothetical protein
MPARVASPWISAVIVSHRLASVVAVIPRKWLTDLLMAVAVNVIDAEPTDPPAAIAEAPNAIDAAPAAA